MNASATQPAPGLQYVARQFNRAAPNYERDAVLQRTVASRLLNRLQFMQMQPALILELGSGTGRTARDLTHRYASARVVEMDLALNMLREARPARWRRAWSRRAWLCADAHRFPIAAARLDMIFSSLMLQWCHGLDEVFSECARTLKTGGLFIFATLGPDTLSELRDSWRAVDDSAHVNAFLDMHDVGDALLRAGLRDPVLEVERFTLTYADVFGLMRDLKQLGAQNANPGRRRSLTGKARMLKVARAYEERRTDGRLPATYEVVYGHAWGAGPRRDPRVATVPLSALRRATRGADGEPGPA